MSCPVFMHVMVNGDIWVGNDINLAPPSGTVAATFRFNSGCTFQKIGTLSGTVGSYAVSNGNGKWGKEIV